MFLALLIVIMTSLRLFRLKFHSVSFIKFEREMTQNIEKNRLQLLGKALVGLHCYCFLSLKAWVHVDHAGFLLDAWRPCWSEEAALSQTASCSLPSLLWKMSLG